MSRCTANVTPSANIRYPNNSWDLNAFTDRYYQKGGGDGMYRFHFGDALYDRKQIPAPEAWIG